MQQTVALVSNAADEFKLAAETMGWTPMPALPNRFLTIRTAWIVTQAVLCTAVTNPRAASAVKAL